MDFTTNSVHNVRNFDVAELSVVRLVLVNTTIGVSGGGVRRGGSVYIVGVGVISLSWGRLNNVFDLLGCSLDDVFFTVSNLFNGGIDRGGVVFRSVEGTGDSGGGGIVYWGGGGVGI